MLLIIYDICKMCEITKFYKSGSLNRTNAFFKIKYNVFKYQ